MMKRVTIILCVWFAVMPLFAAIQLPAIFADSMALQQSANVPVWGRVASNQKVQLTTSWSKTKYTTTANAQGDFRFQIATPAYNDCPYGDITIVAGKEKKQIRNILFAEVWLASGQSNMEMPIRGWRAQPCFGAHEAIAHAAEGLPMRFYTTPHATDNQPQWQGQGSWCTISPATVGDVSACAYYYAREISQVMQTPVAIVQCIWSGTRIEPWMNPEAFTLIGDTVTVLSPKPDRQLPCAIYNAMVNPVVGFGIKGVIWYQGESNRDNAARYLQLFPVMVSEWRRIWKQGEFPFYYAQIAPYTYYPTIEGALIREAQEKASRIIPNSGMAVLIDKGDKYCIHPPYKKEAGLRLAYHALNKTYGMTSLPCESPTLDSICIKQDTVFVTFNNAPDWFVNIGPQQPDMQIAGADSVWYDAKVKLTRYEMMVTSPKVPQPVAVRYCFKNYTIGTLFTPNGLPVAPFRTDNWVVACQRTPIYHTSYFGGGGYITGLVQDPHNPQVMFGRCDVGGVFRTTDGANTWEAVNNDMTFWAQHGCRSICLDTVAPTTIYRCCGNMMNQQHFGYIFRSDDLGEHWTLLTEELDFYGNGPVRNGGEMLTIDPQDHKHIVAGSFSKGLWQSFNRGQTWHYVALKGARIAALRYTHEGDLLVATTYDGTIDSLAKSMDVTRNHPSQLYRFSSDLKESEILYASPHHGIYDIMCPKKGIYLIATTQGLLRSSDNGQTFLWDNIIPQDGLILRLSQSVALPSHIYTARKFSEKDTLRLYESADYGLHWHLYAPNHNVSFRDYPNYGTPDYEWFGASIAAIIPDAKDTNTLHFSNYWGVNTTYDAGQSWTAHNFKGLNILCGESMLFHPTIQGRMYAAICDHGVFVSNDYGHNFELMNPNVSHSSTRCIAAARTNPDFLMWTEGNKRDGVGTPVKRTLNGGQTADTVLFNRGNSYVQALQEDPLHPGRYYLMQEGVFDDPKENGGIYRTDDWGSTWYRLTNPFPHYIKDLPYRRKFIDEDYLPCVCYQTKNGSGTNQLLALDHFREDVVYVGEWTEGIWRSTDGGQSWKNISLALPMREDSTVVLSHIFTDPDNEGTVYAGFWKAGLWRSDDFGDTWTKVRQCNAISIDKHDETILLASCGHGYAPAPTELLLSENNGRTWRNIYDPHLGALRFISVLLDTEHRTAYALTTGNSIVYCNY